MARPDTPACHRPSAAASSGVDTRGEKEVDIEAALKELKAMSVEGITSEHKYAQFCMVAVL